ncbi:MAG: glutamate synthase subunit beta [Calditrichia bacterium]
MGKTTGFLEYNREEPRYRPVEERIHDYKEVEEMPSPGKIKYQAARCMDCGVPFCHIGCPLGNIIPEFNENVWQDLWKEAFIRLNSTNNFPEFTGRLCPAPCEFSCVLGINRPAVSIKQIEKAIVEEAFQKGWITPIPPKKRTGKRVAVIGSGPAGLAAAVQLNKAGHSVTVYEKQARPGGLLRYGIPDFKMEKWIIDRRIAMMEAEGITFITNCEIGKDIPVTDLKKTFDAVVIAVGTPVPRDLPIPGRQLNGIHFALDYLIAQNRVVEGSLKKLPDHLNAENRQVIIIGGGDTGSDCVGTAIRQGAAGVINFELLPEPPASRPEDQPWPYFARIKQKSSSFEEGGDKIYGILSKEISGNEDGIRGIHTVRVKWNKDYQGRWVMEEIPGTEEYWQADMIILALGFLGNSPSGFLKELGVELDERMNVKTTDGYQTTVPGIFVAGDARRGQSLIVWAISEGREAAIAVDEYLMGETHLEEKGIEMELPLR